MVPTPSVAGHQTSMDSQLNHDHAAFEHPEVLPEEIRGFVNKPPMMDPVVINLFEKQNPQVPNLMGPK